MQKLFRIEGSSLMGDKVDIRLPLEAAVKIIRVTGKLPIPDKRSGGISASDLKELTDAVERCLSEDVGGDIMNITTAEGMRLRIYVEQP